MFKADNDMQDVGSQARRSPLATSRPADNHVLHDHVSHFPSEYIARL
jgi:hypothetical protein